MRQTMLHVPDALIEAARIDGASEIRIFFQIVMPLLWPATLTLAIFVRRETCDAFAWPLLIISQVTESRRRKMFFKEVVDLGHELFNNMAGISATSMAAFWPSDTHARSSKISQGELSMESHMILMSEHISTHFDAPFHCDPGGLTADQYPLERLVIPGHLLDFTGKGVREAITPGDFEAAAERSGKPIASGTAVLAWTGQDRNWGKPNFTMDRPYLPTETAEWLVQRGVALFGTDLIGIDDPDDWRWRTHAAFLQNNVPMVQQMCNLGALQGKEFILAVLPLKIRNSTGVPVRPVALVL